MTNKEREEFKRRFGAFAIPEQELERMFRQEELRIRAYMVNEEAFQQSMQMAYSGVAGASQRPTPTPTAALDEATLIYWQDDTTGTWKFFVHNYGTNTNSDIVDTGLDTGDYSNPEPDLIIEQSGFAWQVQGSADDRAVFCVRPDGTVAETFTYPTSGVDGRRNFEFLCYSWYWVDGDQTYVKLFDGNTVATAIIPSAATTFGYNTGGGEVSKTKSISFKFNATTTYVLTTSGDLTDITALVGNNYNSATSYQSDFHSFIKRDGVNVPLEVVIINSDGTLRNTFDLTSYSITNISESSPYGENQWAGTFQNSGVEWVYVKYDYTGNTFSAETLTLTNYPNYVETQDFRETIDSFDNSRPNSVLYFYDTSTTVNWGADYPYLAFMWSIDSGEAHKEVVNAGTGREAYLDSVALYSQYPNFLIGPVGGTGPIEVGVLLDSGAIDYANTGQLSEDCSNVNVILIGSTTMYVFYTNSGDTRFEFWNTSQVETHDVAGTVTWDFYANGSVLVAINNDDYADSFWYTENSPTINAMPALAPTFISLDSGMNWGTLTGVEESKLIFWENNTNGQAFSKLYTLTNEDGLSSEITGNNTASNIDIDLERGVFNWLYADPTSDNIIISQYSLSTGLLLASVDTGLSTITNNNSYGIRSLVWSSDTPTVGSITIWFQGPNGTTTTIIESGNWEYSHNDSEWADNY
jgi:hypothetical protein